MIFFVIIEMIILLTIYFVFRLAEKPNGNILLGVTLPYEQLKNEEILHIVKRYHNANLKCLFIFMFILIPTYLIKEYMSFLLLYSTIFFIILFYVNNKVYMKYFKRLYNLKKENKWFVGATHIVSIDTEVSRLKNTFVVSKLWFAPSLIISLIPLFSTKIQEFYIFSIYTLLMVITYYLSYLITLKCKTITYSENTDINFTLNKVYKMEWSKCWVMSSYFASIFGTITFFFLSNQSYKTIYLIATIIIASISPLFYLVFTYNKIRSIKNKLLLLDSAIIYADDDEFWESGYYYNPNDNRTFVEKRLGIGTTVNMAKTGGKLVNIIWIASLIFMIGFYVAMIPLDFGSINMTVEKNIVKISAPLYRYKFNIDDVVNITVLDSFPKVSNRYGTASDRFYIGTFTVNGYGRCKVCVYRKSNTFLLIELKDDKIFFNSNTQEKTEEFYNELLKIKSVSN